MGGVVGESAGTTIAAIATAAGSGARGVLRLSGPRCRKILGELWVGQAPALAERAIWATPSFVFTVPAAFITGCSSLIPATVVSRLIFFSRKVGRKELLRA